MGTKVAPRPYDLAELERAAGAVVEPRRLRVSGSALAHMRAAGLTERQADHMANRVGLHPGEVWARWWQLDDTECQLDDDTSGTLR